eukprot:357516-Chlamydomonas_euryale.AAC.6
MPAMQSNGKYVAHAGHAIERQAARACRPCNLTASSWCESAELAVKSLDSRTHPHHDAECSRRRGCDMQ